MNRVCLINILYPIIAAGLVFNFEIASFGFKIIPATHCSSSKYKHSVAS